MSDIIGMCWQCGECFLSQSKQQEHGRTEHSLFVCKTCGKMFSKSDVLLQHLVAHSKGMHSCSICGKICREEIDMYIHVLRFHEGKSKTDCDICVKKLEDACQFKIHLKKKHEVQFSSLIVDGESYCTIHSSRSLYKGGLLENPLGIYRKSFKTVDDEVPGRENSKHIEDFLDHSETAETKSLGKETDSNARQCRSTEKPNQMAGNIEMQQHTMPGEMKGGTERAESGKFKCSYCAKCFNSRKSLYEHCRFKHSEEIVACQLCKKYFFNKCLLDGHVKAHVRNVHSCTICGKMCKGLLDIHIHLTTFHKERDTTVCTQCGNTFWSKRNLKYHLLAKHANEFLLIASRAELYCSIHSSENFPEDVMFYDSEALQIFQECSDTREEVSRVQNCRHAEPQDESIHCPSSHLSESNETETTSVAVKKLKTVHMDCDSFLWNESKIGPSETTHFEIKPQFSARKPDKCDQELSPFNKTLERFTNEKPISEDTLDICLENVDTVEDEVSEGENYKHSEVTQTAVPEQETVDMDFSSFQWNSSYETLHDSEAFNISREPPHTLELPAGKNFKPAELADVNMHELSSVDSKSYRSDKNRTEGTTSVVQSRETASLSSGSFKKDKCKEKLCDSEVFNIFQEYPETLEALGGENDNPAKIAGKSILEHSSVDLKPCRPESNRAEVIQRQETPDINHSSLQWDNSYEMLQKSEEFSNFREHSETLQMSVREKCKHADLADRDLYRSELGRAEVAEMETLAMQSKGRANWNCNSLQGDKSILMFYDSEVFNIFQEYSAALEKSVNENYKTAELTEHSS